MRRTIGNIMVAVGCALVLAALGLFLYNQREGREAADFSAGVMAAMPDYEDSEYLVIDAADLFGDGGVDYLSLVDGAGGMTIDGVVYIGNLSIPSLGLELPVRSDWSYPALRQTPCRYFGSLMGRDLVICAHNYDRHFGNIWGLAEGSPVNFTDASGNVWAYEVAVVDTYLPTDVERMISGDFDLTLFTCTYGGRSRVTVGCMLGAVYILK